MTNDVLVVVAALDVRGGVQVRWRRLADELAAERRVTILTWAPRRLPSIRQEGGATVVRVPSLAAWDRDRSKAVEMLNTAVSIGGAVVAALLLRRRWQVAIGAGLHPEAVVAGVAATVLRRRFLGEVWLVGPQGNVARLARSVLRAPVVRVLGRAAAITTAAEAGADELRALGIPSRQIVVEGVYVDAERFAPSSPDRRTEARRRLGVTEPRLLVYTGRFDLRQKELSVLIEAWAGADTDGWELLLVGAGDDRDAVERAAGATPGVRVRDWSEDVPGVLAAADAFVLPTRFENSGYALFEAMACGLPGVASDIDVYDELAPAGVVLVPNQVDAWTEALSALLTAPDDARTVTGLEARRWIEQRSRRSLASCFADLVDR